MKFKVIVERTQTGVVEVDLTDERWHSTESALVRRKRVKGAATEALAAGAEVEWFPIEEPEATTMFAEAR